MHRRRSPPRQGMVEARLLLLPKASTTSEAGRGSSAELCGPHGRQTAVRVIKISLERGETSVWACCGQSAGRCEVASELCGDSVATALAVPCVSVRAGPHDG